MNMGNSITVLLASVAVYYGHGRPNYISEARWRAIVAQIEREQPYAEREERIRTYKDKDDA